MNLTRHELSSLQSLLNRAQWMDGEQSDEFAHFLEQFEIPAEKPTVDSWAADAPDRSRADVERFEADTALQSALWKIDQTCIACGALECDSDIEYVGMTPIHAEDHPYNKNRQAEERQRSY